MLEAILEDLAVPHVNTRVSPRSSNRVNCSSNTEQQLFLHSIQLQ